MDQILEKLPLIIGVTGHRDLREEDIADLEAAVAGVFVRLKRDYLGRRSKTPIVVLSALAEGADQLVARVAVAHGAEVIAPLPLPIAEYRQDFEHGIKPDAAARFDEWLASGLKTPIMPFVGDATSASIDDPARRAEQYRAVGLFIARHCDVLIALWDGIAELQGGTEELKDGGTADIVDLKLNGNRRPVPGTARACLDAPEIGPVIHIVTPRVTGPEGPGAVSVKPWGRELEVLGTDDPDGAKAIGEMAEGEETIHESSRDKLQKDAKLWREFSAQISLNVAFNCAAARLLGSRRGRAGVDKCLDDLFSDAKFVCDTAARDAGLATAPRWCRLYALADALAQKWRGTFKHVWLWMFALGFFALLCFETFAHLAPSLKEGVEGVMHNIPVIQPVVERFVAWLAHAASVREDHKLLLIVELALLGGYILTFVVLVVLFTFVRLRQPQEKFLDYRALAEALRVATFWKLNNIGSAGDRYPIKLPSELAWVKNCLMRQEMFDAADNARTGATDPRSYDWTRRLWIEGQFAYYRSKGVHHFKTAERWERRSLRILMAALAIAVGLFGVKVLIVSGFVKPDEGWSSYMLREGWLHELCIFGIGLLPGLAAVFVGLAEQLAFKAQSRQFDRMQQLFGRALKLIRPDGTTNPDFVKDVFRELGTEAMRENAEWVAIYRQRPIRLPQG